MTYERAKEIRLIWEEIEAREPTLPTMQLLIRTTERAGCQAWEVGEASYLMQEHRKTVRTGPSSATSYARTQR